MNPQGVILVSLQEDSRRSNRHYHSGTPALSVLSSNHPFDDFREDEVPHRRFPLIAEEYELQPGY